MSKSGDASRTSQLRPPSDSDWEALIYTFRVLRSFEDSAIWKRAKALPALLRSEGATLCDVADQLDRTLDTNADLSKYRASVLFSRIEGQGYADDPLWKFVHNDLIQRLLEAVTKSPSALRQSAFALQDAGDDAQDVVDVYERETRRLRGSRGPSPSVAMYRLFASTDGWRSSVLEIARQLVKAGVLSESASDEPDPIRRWESILSKARKRARLLRKAAGTG